MQPATLKLDNRFIQNFVSNAESVSNVSTVEYGCLSNTGNITINDIGNTLYHYAELGYLDADVFKMIFKVNDDVLQTHIPQNTRYSSEDSTYTVRLTNNITLWNDISVASESNPLTFSGNTNLLAILRSVLNKADVDDTMLDLSATIIAGDGTNDSETTVENYLKAIVSEGTITIEDESVTQIVNEICTVAQLNCYQDDTGLIKFVSSRPKQTSLEKSNPIIVEYSDQFTVPETSILVANRYDDVIIK